MKVSFSYIKIIALVTLTGIIVNQIVWVYNMYNSYQYKFELLINKSLEDAVFIESSDRQEQLGGYILFSPVANKQDSTRFLTKTITYGDSIYKVQIDRYDPYSINKLVQFFIKDDLPTDVNKLDSIFRQKLINEKYPIRKTSVEYIDISTNEVLAKSCPPKELKMPISSDILSIDVLDSLGVKAYVESPVLVILGMMIFQLILSIIMIVISIACIYYLIRTIYWQNKEEKMRQDSINAMTHEFKRPISSAIMQVALIPYYLDNNKEKVRQYAENVLLELNKLTAYTERIQHISNNSKEDVVLNRTDIEIRPFFESVIEKYSAISDKQVKIEFEISSVHNFIHADLLHFSNVIENLLENAIKYSGEQTNISIHISDDNKNLKIAIKDNGFGISKIDINYIFDRFYRSKTKNIQKRTGFGLGLTYVKAIIEAHKGKVKVASEVGVGSEFTIYFPVE